MTVRRRDVELSVERAVGPPAAPGTVARLTVRLEPPADGGPPDAAELKSVLEELVAELDAVVGVPLAGAPAARPDRELEELVETYRPRQRELVDLLLADGEITGTEHARLLRAVPETSRPAPAPRLVAPAGPIAAAPVATDSSPTPVRPVESLLAEYQIASLRQAGAVRARRQISFAEYMALKRHFERPGGPDAAAPR